MFRLRILALAPLLAANVARAAPPDCPALGAALVDHSCFHSRYGPFTTVLATPGSAISTATPKLDAVHTEFRVGLAGTESSATYEPQRSGAWSVFEGSDVPLRVFDPIGAELAPLLVFNGGTGCDALPIAHVFELEAFERYRFRFGPADVTDVVVVIEYVDDFLIANGRDADGDGYGRPDDVVLSSCVPPPGYVQNDSDCDDSDPEKNPGALELCDGIDQNCNGLPDDVGLTCRAGQGACQATGEAYCAEPGAAIACTAVPLVAASEICNGVDDDCNGAIDDGANLCPDVERPTCVRDRQAAFCGCLLDLDCGPGNSGRICDTSERRCLAGCAQEPGRSGCPSGERCRIDAGAFTCVPDDTLTPDAGTDAAVDAGAAGAQADAGDEKPGAAGTAGRPGGEPRVVEACGCRAVGAAPREPAGAFLLLALALGWTRRAARSWRGLASLVIAGLGLIASACGGKTTSGAGTSPMHTGSGGGDATGMDAALDSSAGGGDAGQGGDPCTPELGRAVVVHACSHTTNGPFVPVAAVAPTAAEPANVSRLHTTFEVEVVEPGAELRYVPGRNGEHVLLTDAHVELQLIEGEETVTGEALAVSGCETLRRGIAVTLEKGASYRLLLAAEPRNFRLFFEHLATFGAAAWNQTCSD